MSFSKLWEFVMNRAAWRAAVHGVTKSQKQLSDWTKLNWCLLGGFLGGSVVKNLPAMQDIQEMQVWSLDREDPLEKEMATHSSILAWKIPWTSRVWWAIVHGVTNSQIWLSNWTHVFLDDWFRIMWYPSLSLIIFLALKLALSEICVNISALFWLTLTLYLSIPLFLIHLCL